MNFNDLNNKQLIKKFHGEFKRYHEISSILLKNEPGKYDLDLLEEAARTEFNLHVLQMIIRERELPYVVKIDSFWQEIIQKVREIEMLKKRALC